MLLYKVWLLRVSCLKLEINEVRCYEVQIEEQIRSDGLIPLADSIRPDLISCDTGSHQESNPGHLWLEPPVLHIEDCEGWWLSGVLSWLSGRALAAQARGVLGLTPSGCRCHRKSDPGGSNPLAESIRQIGSASGSDPPPDQFYYITDSILFSLSSICAS